MLLIAIAKRQGQGMTISGGFEFSRATNNVSRARYAAKYKVRDLICFGKNKEER